MSHQPYETWLYDEAVLSNEQAQTLLAHLQECQQCRELREAWKNLEERIMDSSMVSPQPGFSQRWLASLTERRARQQLLQVKRLFIGLLVSSLIILAMLGVVFFLTASPVNLLVAVFESFTSLVIRGNQIQRIIVPWLETVPLIIPIAVWVLFSTFLSLLTLFWIYSLWQIFTKGVHKNESPV